MSCMFSQITFSLRLLFPQTIPTYEFVSWDYYSKYMENRKMYYQNDSKYLPKRDVNWPFPVSLRWRAQFTDRSGRRWNLRGRRLKSSAEQMLGVITSSNPRARYLKQTADSEWWNSVNAGHTGQMPCVKRTLRSCCC